MKKLLLLLALWCVPAYAQLPTQKDSTGNITASGSTCATTNACINIHLANNASTVAVTLSGTFSATLTYETSGDNGVTWTTLDTQTAPGTVTYTIVGLTDMRVRASAFTSGTVGVFINSSTAAVSSLGSVTLTGTPSVGWVPTATSATTATWQAAGGGGGGLSGMTAGQIPVAATATTVTSSLATTGTGNVVRATSPALTTPTGIVKGDVGLGNVVNLDTSNASNITTGTLPVGQIPATVALLASPTFTGTPAAPTAAVSTNTTQVATTAFVMAQSPPITTAGTHWISYCIYCLPASGALPPMSVVANVGSFFLFTLPVQAKITKMAFYVNTGTAATTGDVGIYSISGTTGTLVAHTGSVATTATGLLSVTLGSPVTLNPGQYYEASCNSATTPIVQGVGGGTNISALLGGAATPANSWGPDATDTCTAGVLPTTITTTNIANAITNNYAPVAILMVN